MERILIDAFGNNSWIGGLYYKYNIIYSLLQNEYIVDHCELFVMVDSSSQKLFEKFKDAVTLINVNITSHRDCQFKIIINYIKYRCNYFYCGFESWYRLFGVNEICWIPDFQAKESPHNFSAREVEKWDKIYGKISRDHRPLVLSSHDSYHSFRKYYGSQKKEVYIVPFVSYIEPTLSRVSQCDEIEIISRYKLTGIKYACIMNQFWKHKNHKVVFEAISKLKKSNNCPLTFVFTGKMEDYRNPDYTEYIKKIIDDNNLNDNIRILGFIERNEQLVIMKNASFVIQPSLFEGWGTVVEDAKVLNKTILLSDIPVHREQMNMKCKLFDPHNPEELAQLISEEMFIEHNDNMYQWEF